MIPKDVILQLVFGYRLCKHTDLEQHHLSNWSGGLTLVAAMRGLSLWLCTVGDLTPGKKTAALTLKLMSSLVPLGPSPCDLAWLFDSLLAPFVPCACGGGLLGTNEEAATLVSALLAASSMSSSGVAAGVPASASNTKVDKRWRMQTAWPANEHKRLSSSLLGPDQPQVGC